MNESLRLPPSESSGVHVETTEDIKEVLDAEQTLLYAFEKAGLIKPIDEISLPVDRIINEAELKIEPADDTFPAKRDTRSLGEMAIDEAVRNQLQQRITDKINELQTYDDDSIRALRNWGKWYSQKNGVPRIQEILKGLIFPDKDAELPKISEDASDLAPDIYWMMLREDEEAQKNAEVTAVA
jgi:hypothetical protein